MTEGIQAVYLQTHNWGKSVRFLQRLGYVVDFETDHDSGRLRHPTGPWLFVTEVPEDRQPNAQLVVAVADENTVDVDGLDVVTPFETTHWGARELELRDPDGRIWRLHVMDAK